MDVVGRQLVILWWNVNVTARWHDGAFWEVIDHADIVFLNETHHTVLPIKAGWRVHGGERLASDAAGGTLALVRDSCPV